MLNQHLLERQWSDIRNRLRERWTEVSSDDLTFFNGTVDELVELINRRTGEARHMIRDQLAEIMDDLGSISRCTGNSLAEGGEQMKHAAGSAAMSVLARLDRAQHAGTLLAKRHPSETVALCLGLGMFAGLVMSNGLRRR